MNPASDALVLDLLLGPQLVAVTTLLLAAVDSPRVQARIASVDK
jgi:hypothetical protein